jgi:hypothetical protein
MNNQAWSGTRGVFLWDMAFSVEGWKAIVISSKSDADRFIPFKLLRQVIGFCFVET